MTQVLKEMLADFRTSLSAKISAGGESGTLQNNIDDDGVTIPNGKYCFTLDADSAQKEHIVCTLTGKNMTDIKSVSRQGVETVGTVREHRIGATVTITDFSHIYLHNELLKGDTAFDASKPLKYDADPTLTDDKEIATKKYIDDVAIAGSPKATETVYGIAKLSSAAADPTAPVVLNNEEVDTTGGAGKVPKANANGLVDSSFIIDTAADSGLEEGADGGTKVKVDSTLNIGASGLSVNIQNINVATLPVPVFYSISTNKIYSCDGNDLNKLIFIGFAISNSTDTNPITVQTSGKVPGFTGLTPGFTYYISDTIGTISKTPGTNYLIIGKAISSTEILIDTKLSRLYPSSNLVTSADTLQTISGSTPTKYKEIAYNDINGFIRVSFLLNRPSSGVAYGRIYKNGVAYGTERNTAASTTFTEDLYFETGDLIQFYGWTTGNGEISNFRLYYTRDIIMVPGTVNLN